MMSSLWVRPVRTRRLALPATLGTPERVPGGSSGGSAAAVAAGFTALALGSDTGGSVRQPAAFCGVVGLRPTWGSVSRWGLVAFASSLDQIGPLTTTVRDAGLAYEIMAGADGRDTTVSRRAPKAVLEGIEEGIDGIEVGVLSELGLEGLPADVQAGWEAGLGHLEAAGARLRDVSVPLLPVSTACYYVVAVSEASANLARFDGVRYGHRSAEVGDLQELYARSRGEGLGEEVKRRLLLGTHALSAGYHDAYYGRAQQVRRALRQALEEVLQEVDVLVTPSTPTAAFRLGERVEDPLSMYLSDTFTTPASLAGLPALSVPVARNRDGLPLGFQIMGSAWDEAKVLRVGRAVEIAVGWTPIGERDSSS